MSDWTKSWNYKTKVFIENLHSCTKSISPDDAFNEWYINNSEKIFGVEKIEYKLTDDFHSIFVLYKEKTYHQADLDLNKDDTGNLPIRV